MKHRPVIRSAAVVGACTGISRVLGLLRNVLMAAYFGTSLAQSAFVVAFCVPNLFRRLFGEGALSAAFVPVFSDVLHKEGRASAWKLAGAVLGLLMTVLSAMVALVVVGIGWYLHVIGGSGKTIMILRLTQIMFPYMLFICAVALCMAILNSFRHFLVPALTPVLLNLVWMGALLFVCPLAGPSANERVVVLAWCVLAAGVIQFLAQIPALMRYGFRFRFSSPWGDPRVRRVLVLMGPAAIGMGVFQINVIVDKLLAILVGSWAPAAMFYAEMLVYLPLGIFATALGTVLLPTFSAQAAATDGAAIRDTLSHALRMLLLVMVPAAVGLLVLSESIVSLLYRWREGQFDETSVMQTSRALMFYAPGLVVFSVYKLLVPVFYAMQDTKTPVRIGVRMVFLNLGLNILFVVTWPEGFKHAGLAFATVLSSAANALCLAVILHRRIGSPRWTAVWATFLRSLAAALVMAAAAVMVRQLVLQAGIPLHVKAVEGLAVGCAIAAGVVCYFGAGMFLMPRDARELWRSLR